MDNFHIDITSEGSKSLRAALDIAISHAGGKATHYAVRQADTAKKRQGPRLILYWSAETAYDVAPLPFVLNASNIGDFVEGWLAQNSPQHAEPDHDGDNGKGWRVWISPGLSSMRFRTSPGRGRAAHVTI